MTTSDEAQRLISAGRTAEAESLLRRELGANPSATGLRVMLAQVLAGTGRKPEALDELIRATQSSATRAARLMLARIANELKRWHLAAEHARALTGLDPRDSEAWSALGTAAFGLGHKREAAGALERAIEVAPAYAAARYNLAAVLCAQERSEQALAQADAALRHGARPRSVAMIKARALIQLDRFDEAEQLMLDLLRANRNDEGAHGVLLQLRQMRGDDEPLRELRSVAVAGAPATLRLALADAERRSGSTTAAERILRTLMSELGPDPRLQSSLATVLQEVGRVAEALELARAAFNTLPEEPGTAENFVVAALGAGAAAAALPVVEKFRARLPRDQRWITYRIDIARLRGERELEDWYEPSQVVSIIDLPPPEGYSTTADFHAALVPALEQLHRQRNHPLDQSLRHGTQTSRNLLVQPGPEIAALLMSFDEALRESQARWSHQADHPFRARNESPAEIVGCWSVRLRRGGFHVNHIHPEGWISSAYYVSVPPEANDMHTRAGWLKFGEPRFAVPGLSAVSFVQPVPGRLVLFPSYLWHGTHALAGDAPRMSVAFDALPRAEIL